MCLILIACSKSPIVETPSKISRDKIFFYEDKAIINLEDYTWFYFNESSTNSMYPTITKSSHALGLKVTEKTPINIGDIISFKASGMMQNYIHRVIEKGFDEEGEFFITKGDNNNKKDNIRIRRQNIFYLITAIIY